MNFLSPMHLEIGIKRWEYSIAKTMSTLHPLFQLVCTLLLGGGIIFLSTFLDGHFAKNGGFALIKIFKYTVLFILLASLLKNKFATKWKSYFNFAILCTTWIYLCFETFRIENTILFLALASFLPLLTLFFWLLLKYEKIRKNIELTTSLIVVFLAAYLMISYALYSIDHKLLRNFLRFNIHVLFISFIVHCWNKSKLEISPATAFCPTNAVHGFFWPSESKFTESAQALKILWWQGYCNLAVGYAAIGIRMLVEKQLLNHAHIKFFFWFNHYILAILAIVGTMNILSGACRIFGFAVPDATNFIWLSRTPAEYWRRGLVYQYQFIFRYVFLPLQRILKNTFAASTIAFFLFFLLKNGPYQSAIFTADIFGENWYETKYQRKYEYYLFTIWGLWFLSKSISQRYWLIPHTHRQNPFWGWVSIAFTHALMGSLYYLAHILQYVWWNRSILW